jgi:ABC-2 type transport system ATP-binding protein
MNGRIKMNYVIEIQNLSKSYGKTLALDNISLKIPKGSIYGYLGPNGAGKTTTMKILTGLLHYREGTVKIFDEEVKSSSSINKKHYGFLPDATMPNNYSIRRFLTISGRLANLPNLKDTIRSSLKQLGLLKLQNQKIGTLSKGQRQRVGLANALLANPPLLILDEPNAGLDPIGRLKILTILKDLVESEGKTVLLSSHIIGEVDKIATHIAIINHGNLLEQGKRDSIQKGILEQSKFIIGGKLNLTEVSQFNYVVSSEIDHFGRYVIQINTDSVTPNQFLLDLIQKAEGEIQYFSAMDLSLEDHFLKKINGRSSSEVCT